VLAGGVHPACRRDQTPFDDDRFELRGFELAQGMVGALCEMRADLLEFVSAC
jgi:hypothetical protein